MQKVVQAVGGGAAGSWAMINRSGNMIKNSYPLGFKVRLHRKDLDIALEVARDLGVTLPVTAYVEQVETGLIARGHGDEGHFGHCQEHQGSLRNRLIALA